MTYEQMNNNKVMLKGKIISEPIYSHQVFGEGFYEMKISVPRLSGQNDVINITISDRLVDENNIKIGSEICINGQFRSYNKIESERSKLILTCFVRELVENESGNINNIELNGFICKPPIYRMTPFNREICDLLIAVNRAYNKSDYIPCIAWGRNARFLKTQAVGEKISISGRIQSREYRKVLQEGEVDVKLAYEVSINKIASNENKNFTCENFTAEKFEDDGQTLFKNIGEEITV